MAGLLGDPRRLGHALGAQIKNRALPRRARMLRGDQLSPREVRSWEVAIPADDPQRKVTVVKPDSPNMRHVSIAGDSSGGETAGPYYYQA